MADIGCADGGTSLGMVGTVLRELRRRLPSRPLQAGVEAGFGLEYADPARGLTVEGRVRGLLAHADSAYEDWDASGSLRLDPGVQDRGLSLTLAPA